jgi:hypothetical protein
VVLVSADAFVPSKDQLIAAMTAGETIPDADALVIPDAPATGGPGKLNRNDVPPSVLSADWLPPDERWPELNDLRDTHVRLRQQARSASTAVYTLQREFEAEDKAKDEALKAGFAAGVEPDLPEITSDADRESQLKDAKAISKAASAASLDHIDKVLEVFGTRYPEFLGDLDAEDRELNLEIAEARARLAELEARNANTNERTRQWIERIRRSREDGLPVQMLVMRWDETPVAHASDTDADTKAAYGDGTIRTSAPASPSRPAASSSVVLEGDGEEVELADLEDEDIVDWLMGAGMFDGESKPTVADVVGVVEPDNPALARRVLAAETTAQGGKPRQGVADALNKIIGSEASHE